MKRSFTTALLASLLIANPVASGEPQRPVQLPKVDVVGKVAGPPIWELRRGNKVLWIVGTLYPVPKDVAWSNADIERRIAQSQVVIGSMGMSVGEDIGLFRGLFLLPALLKARNNPDGQTLQDVLPPATYMRWTSAKATYIGRDSGIEKRRPLYAAFELFEAALKRQGLAPVKWLDVKRIAKAQRVPVRDPRVKVDVDSPRKALKQLSHVALPDTRCLEETLDRIDTDLGTMRIRAEAWAAGDLAQLRGLPYREQFDTCAAALSANDVARAQGITDIKGQVQARWLAEARNALREHDRVFASLPLRTLLAADGPIRALQDEGYMLIPPGDEVAVGHREQDGAPPRRVEGQGEHR